MTIEEIKKNYGDYVACISCPLNRSECEKYALEDKVSCDGGDVAYARIKKHFDAIVDANKSDNVNHPKHYQGKHECIDEMIALFGVDAVRSFCMCNVYKYRFRAAQKNGAEDLAKADWYMDKLMELNDYGKSNS